MALVDALQHFGQRMGGDHHAMARGVQEGAGAQVEADVAGKEQDIAGP